MGSSVRAELLLRTSFAALRRLCAVYIITACWEPRLHAGARAMHLMCTFVTLAEVHAYLSSLASYHSALSS